MHYWCTIFLGKRHAFLYYVAMLNDLHDMIRVSCEEAITPDIAAEIEFREEERGTREGVGRKPLTFREAKLGGYSPEELDGPDF